MSRRNKLGNKEIQKGAEVLAVAMSAALRLAKMMQMKSTDNTTESKQIMLLPKVMLKEMEEKDLDVEDDKHSFVLFCNGIKKGKKLASETWIVYPMTWCSILTHCVVTRKMQTNT